MCPGFWFEESRQKKNDEQISWHIKEHGEGGSLCAVGFISSVFLNPTWLLKNLNIELLYDLVNPLQAIYPKEFRVGIQRNYLYIHVHNSIIYNSRRWEATQASTNRWTNKMWSIHTTIHYWVLNRMKILHMLHEWTLKTLRFVK